MTSPDRRELAFQIAWMMHPSLRIVEIGDCICVFDPAHINRRLDLEKSTPRVSSGDGVMIPIMRTMFAAQFVLAWEKMIVVKDRYGILKELSEQNPAGWSEHALEAIENFHADRVSI